MRPRRGLLACSVCLAACVWAHAAPVLAELQSAGLLDRASEHFHNSLLKWGSVMTAGATTLFWMLATIALCWELGGLAMRGGSMDEAIAFLLRFGFIEGLWLFVLRNAVPIGTAIIDSLRKLGANASGLPQNLMPSSILDVGFSILWKTITFVFFTGPGAPVVAAAALFMALVILMSFALTALNMLLLIISQWFLLYGGIFFLGFGGAPWESIKARTYLELAISIGAQLLGMAGVVGIGQSFIQEQYAHLSGDTNLGELAVILIVAVLSFLLSNEIPKMFARFSSAGHVSQGFGVGTLLGGMVSAAAALGASAAMAKAAAESVAGVAKAVGAAHSAAAKSQSSQRPPPARSQTGLSTGGSNGGSIGPAGGDSSDRAGTRTQGPLGAMLNSSGIGGTSRPGANSNGSSPRAGTNTTPAKPAADTTQKPPASQSTAQAAEEQPPAAQANPQHTQTGGAESNTAAAAASETSSSPTAANPAARTPADEPTPPAGGAIDAEQAPVEASEAESGTAEGAAGEASESCEPVESTQNADTGSEPPTDENDAGPSDAHSASAPTELASSTADTASGDANAAASAAITSSVPSAQSAASSAVAASATTNEDAGASGNAVAAAPAATNAAGAAASPPSGASTSDTGSGAAASSSAPAVTGAQPAASSAGAAGSGSADAPAPASGASQSGAEAAHSASPHGAESGRSATTSEASAAASAPTDPGASGEAGGQRGSTSIAPSSAGSTLIGVAKILGQHTVQHQVGRWAAAKKAFLARADQTAGGRIAAAIRKDYGLEEEPKKPPEGDGSATGLPEHRSPTGGASDNHAEQAATSASGPRSPADWVTGDDPMTDNQFYFLQRRLGDDVDPNMTKAEASILIEELLNED